MIDWFLLLWIYKWFFLITRAKTVCPSFWTEYKCCLTSQLIKVKSYRNWVNMCNSWDYAQGFLTGDICIKHCIIRTYFQKRDCLDKCHSDSWQCYVTLLCILGWTTWICCRYNSIKCGIFFYLNWLGRDRAFYKALMWASLLFGSTSVQAVVWG